MAGERMWMVFPKLRCVSVITVLVLMSLAGWARGEEGSSASGDERFDQLERHIMQLTEEMRQLKEERKAEQQQRTEHQELLQELRTDMGQMEESKWLDPDSWLNKFTLGGYGEMHANFGEGKTADLFDIHRLVLYLGYDFNEWIKFHSEIELEHAFVSSGSGGEVSIEQAYVDFLTNPKLNFRVGRILTPLGIINKKHEPPTFNGVERPSFAKFIIPSTWSSDGVGIFGTLAPWLKYELYAVAGLDGSEFSATGGIRGGRIKERPSLHEPAVTGRFDFYPLAGRDAPRDQKLRVGLSSYFGGLDNGNKGSNPGINGEIFIYSADFEYSICKFDFRGAIAHEIIDGAGDMGSGTASQIFGWYAEGAYHFWPEAWKKGKLEKSDAVVFVRYDVFDTQHKMPSGVSRDPAGDRSEWTIGMNFYPIPNLVLKVDYQIRRDGTGGDLDNLLNVGIGWQF